MTAPTGQRPTNNYNLRSSQHKEPKPALDASSRFTLTTQSSSKGSQATPVTQATVTNSTSTSGGEVLVSKAASIAPPAIVKSEIQSNSDSCRPSSPSPSIQSTTSSEDSIDMATAALMPTHFHGLMSEDAE